MSSRLLGLLALAAALAPLPARATVIVEVTADRSRAEAIAEALGVEMSRALEGCGSGALVVRIRSELPEGAPEPHALVHALVSPAVAALAGDAERWPRVHQASFPGDGDDAAERARRLGYDVLLDLSVRMAGNFIELRGATWRTDPAARHLELAVRSRLDVELRHYLGALPRASAETLVARAAELPSRGYLALASHDLDGDGRTELVAVTATSVAIFRLGATRFGVRLVEVASAMLPADVPRAPSPSRRPLATAVSLDRALVVRTSELGAPVRVELGEGGMRLSRASGPCPDAAFPIDAGCARLARGRDYFGDDLSGPEGARRPAAGTFYVHAQRRVRRADASVIAFEAIVTPQGRLAARIGERTVATAGYGTALAMTDLDDDGAPELLASSTRPAGTGDQLTVLRLVARGAIHVVWRSEALAGSVWIAARGDLDGDGLDELLAVEEPAQGGNARLWMVR